MEAILEYVSPVFIYLRGILWQSLNVCISNDCAPLVCSSCTVGHRAKCWLNLWHVIVHATTLLKPDRYKISCQLPFNSRWMDKVVCTDGWKWGSGIGTSLGNGGGRGGGRYPAQHVTLSWFHLSGPTTKSPQNALWVLYQKFQVIYSISRKLHFLITIFSIISNLKGTF